MKTFVKVSFHN